MEGKKISALTEKTLASSDLQNVGNIYIPVLAYQESTNYKIDLSKLYKQVENSALVKVEDRLDAFVASGGNQQPGEQPGETDNTAFNALVNRVAVIENRINQFNDPTYWPTNYIGIKDINTNNTIYYALPSGPGQSGIRKDEIIITQADVQLPDMYFEITIETPISEQNGCHKVIVDFTPKTKQGGLNLPGGTIKQFYIYGVMNTSSGSVDIGASLTLGEQGTNGITFAANTETFSPSMYQVAFVSTYPTTTTINNIEIKAKVGVVDGNSIKYADIPGAAMYYKSGISMVTQQATGYVTLPTNGS